MANHLSEIATPKPPGYDGGKEEKKIMTTIVRNDFDEVRVTEAAEYIRKKLNELFEPGTVGKVVLKDCPTHKNGLTNAEAEVAIIRALGLMVIDGMSGTAAPSIVITSPSLRASTTVSVGHASGTRTTYRDKNCSTGGRSTIAGSPFGAPGTLS